MEPLVREFLDFTYEKLRLLKRTDRGEVWLVADRDGRLGVMKRSVVTGLPLKALQELKLDLCPRILYLAESPADTVWVEEYIAGTPLSDRLRQKKYLTEKEAATFLLALTDSLSRLHCAGIIHRDIKPANLLVEKSGAIRLIDFDASRMVKPGEEEDTHRLGTKGYAPPEQFGYGQTDERSDIFSLGVTFQKLLGPEYQGWLAPLLAKCTRLDAAQRYATAAELRQALLKKFHRKVRQIIPAALVIIACLVMIFSVTEHREREKTESLPAETRPADNASATKTPPQNPAPSVSPAPNTSANSPIQAASTTPPKEIPTPALPPQEPTAPLQPLTPSPKEKDPDSPAPETTAEEDKPSYLRAKIYVNGEYANAWMENWQSNIKNGGTTLEIPRSAWQSWQLEQNGTSSGPITTPAAWQATVCIENHTAMPWDNPQCEISYQTQEGRETKVLRAAAIQPGETLNLAIPLGGYQLSASEETLNSTGGRLTLNISGDGVQELFCSRYSISFMCLSE